jgi:RNA polymerase sigma-70 factor, ECF subfamily
MESADDSMKKADDYHEKQIINKIRKGDSRAYAELVSRYQTPIYNLMLRMSFSEDQALDLTQETFVRAYEKIDRFDQNKKFFSWLYTLGLNLARDYMRKYANERYKMQSLDLMAMKGEEPQVSNAGFDRIIETQYLDKALSILPEDMREALVLRFMEGFSYQEIADTLNIGLSNAKMKVRRGLDKMRTLLNSA